MNLRSEYSTQLLKDSEIILAVFFKQVPVVEKLRVLAVVPRDKYSTLPLAHLIHAIIRYVGISAYVIEVFLGIEIVRVPRFGDRQTVGFG